MAERDQGLPPEVVAALQRGRKIQAIKLLCELKGVGLKEAKDAVDDYTLERPLDGGSVVQPGGHGGIFGLLVLLALGVAVVWIFGGL